MSVKPVDNLDPTQNEDIRYLLRVGEETVEGNNVKVMTLNREHREVERAGKTLQAAFEATAGHRISAAEADKLAGYVTRESNSQYDRNELARGIAEVYALAESGADTETFRCARAGWRV